MTGPVVGEREGYALAVAAYTARIVQAVHDEDTVRITREIKQAVSLVAPAGVDPVVALVTVLAAQVPAFLPMATRLGWVADRGAAGAV